MLFLFLMGIGGRMILSITWLTSAEIFWLSLLFIICCLPAVLFIGGHRLRIPIMPMWGAGYFMLFGMPFFSKDDQGLLFSVPPETVQAALQLVVLGGVCCLAIFYTFLGNWVEATTPSIQAPWDLRRAPRSGIALCMVGLVFQYFTSVYTATPALQQILSILSRSSILGMVTLFLLQLRGKLSGRLKVFLWGFFVPLQYVLGLGTGLVFNVILMMVPFLFCYIAERRTVPLLAMGIAIAVLIVPFLGFKKEFRSYAWYNEENVTVPKTPVGRGVFFLKLVFEGITKGGSETYTAAAETAQERAGSSGLLIITAISLTPDVVPYWKGETYISLLWLFVPRFLYPDKPTKMLGQEFGHRYGILDEDDLWTSVNLPHQVVEMYINFGKIGVFLGMALIGCLYRMIAALLGRPESGERALLIGCTIATVLLGIENDFSLVFGGLFYYLVIFYVVLRFFHGNVAPRGKISAGA